MTRILSLLWKKTGSIHLTVVLCLCLTADLAWGYLCLNRRTALFAPLGDVGLIDWIRTYGSHHLLHTFWFFLLLALLTLLCLNTFACTTDRVILLVRTRSRFSKGRLLYKFAPHVMHYAMIVILAGYLVSYLFSEVYPGQTLVPGASLTLPGRAAQFRFVSLDTEYYQGTRLSFFDNWVIRARAHLILMDNGVSQPATLTYHRPIRFKGYRIYLDDFTSKKKGGMGMRVRIDIRIRKDPGVHFYIAGMILFTVGLLLYVLDALFLKGGLKGNDMKPITRSTQGLLALLLATVLCACGQGGGDKRGSFIDIGEFTVNRISEERTDVRDGAGRTLVLIPRNAPAPADCRLSQVVRTPVERVAVYGFFDVATLRALGVLEKVLVGVTHPAEGWYIDEVKQGMDSGRIAYLGDASSIDFERLKQQKPELVLTWDPSIIPMLDEIQIPCAVTSTPTAMCLNARMRFVQFLAPFFHREKEAWAFFDRVNNTLMEIRERTAGSGQKPKVMWGDIYEKRVMVEPGNAWVGELVGLAQSDYLFNDVYGTSCIEIAVERFLYSGEEADILFTYRSSEDGATSKAAVARMNPLLADIRPLKAGKVYAPLPHYTQSGDRLDEILTEISAILHPDVYPNFERRFFVELPDTDLAPQGDRS